jgi:hypothetical protein
MNKQSWKTPSKEAIAVRLPQDEFYIDMLVSDGVIPDDNWDYEKEKLANKPAVENWLGIIKPPSFEVTAPKDDTPEEELVADVLKYVYDEVLPGVGLAHAQIQSLKSSVASIQIKKPKDKITFIKGFLERGKYKGLMAAVLQKLQFARDAALRIPSEIGITVEELAENDANMNLINAVRKFSSKTTQSIKYQNLTAPAQKKFDAMFFEVWISINSNPVSRIMRLNYEDIDPFTYNAQITAFLANPEDKTTQEAMKAAVDSLKARAVKAWRADKANFNIEDFLNL